MLDDLTSEQISEWVAYDRLDPIGPKRNDYGWALLCSVVTNLVMDIYSKKGSQPKHVAPADFLPDWDGSKEKISKKPQTVEEQKAFLLRFAAKHNKRKKHG